MSAALIVVGGILAVFATGHTAEALWAERNRLEVLADRAGVSARSCMAAAVTSWATAAVFAGALVSAVILYGAASWLWVKARRAALDAADRRAGAR